MPPADLADGRPRRLDARVVPCARLAGLATVLVGAVLAGIVQFTVRAEGVLALGFPALLLLAAALVLVSVVWTYPSLRYRHCSWRLHGFGLEIRDGVWLRRVISVPRARVQRIEVQRGPLQRRFGLAAVVVHTAGHQDSEVRLSGLARATALALRDDLLGHGGMGEEDELDAAPIGTGGSVESAGSSERAESRGDLGDA